MFVLLKQINIKRQQVIHNVNGLSGLVAEMIQAADNIGTHLILDVCNGIVKEGCIPEDWKSSVVLPIYKGKRIQWSVDLTEELKINAGEV